MVTICLSFSSGIYNCQNLKCLEPETVDMWGSNAISRMCICVSVNWRVPMSDHSFY